MVPGHWIALRAGEAQRATNSGRQSSTMRLNSPSYPNVSGDVEYGRRS